MNYGGAIEYDFQLNRKICNTQREKKNNNYKNSNLSKKENKILIELGLLNSQDFFFTETQFPVLLEIINDL